MNVKPTGGPILIPCEGSGCPPAAGPFGHPFGQSGMCSMCGQSVECGDDDRAVEHQRDDILARLRRGDFG